MVEKYELIIAEKPNASLKIAEALADKRPKKVSLGKVSYYELEHKGKKIVVGCAVGHLFNLAEKDKKKGWTYPIFNYEWKASYLVSKSALFSKAYVDVLKKLALNADQFTLACDYDVEGSTIGWNVLQFLCHKTDGKRMKFSTLTKDELVESYEHAMPHLDFPQIECGVTRHSLDWLWGLNLSRALTLSVKNATNMFKILSTGRVQGPTLKVLYDREKEIEIFKPTPYWEIDLHGKTQAGEEILAWHKEGKFLDRKKAEAVLEICKGQDAVISHQETHEFKHKPPFPFDLTSLQIEAYSVLGISPQRTLDLAQDLYSNGYISYPRTSSQKLPLSINYKKILSGLSSFFQDECKILMQKKQLQPHEGKKEDPAHPAIYPTGELPKALEDKAGGLYELIVRRFFATFGDDATRETLTLDLDVCKEIFIAKGTRTKERGWYVFYGRFLKLEEEELPVLKLGEIVKVLNINLYDKETKPPARYTEASLIKELDKQNLGTKATRSNIIQNLYDRNYIVDKSIAVTDLGMKTTETLDKYCPEILDPELTRKFEEEMDAIAEGKRKGEEVIEDAKKFLTKALEQFKLHEKEIGKDLGQSALETRDKEAFLGKCVSCKEGNLQMRRGKFGLFAACDRYEQGCKTTFALPKNGKIKATEKLCSLCTYPTILVFRLKKKPQELCINLNCQSKKAEEEKIKLLVVDKKCPHCGSGLVVKNGIYGVFAACPGYPKCKYIEKLPKLE